jgi:hypothetical protein
LRNSRETWLSFKWEAESQRLLNKKRNLKRNSSIRIDSLRRWLKRSSLREKEVLSSRRRLRKARIHH